MDDVDQLVETGRQLLRENSGLSEAGFRDRMLERFRAHDQGLQQDKTNMTGGSVDPMGGVFSLLALPWIFWRWLGWLGRLRRHRADMDETVRILRGEGHFAA